MLSKVARDFPPKKKGQNLASAMQVNERYSSSYSKERFMCAIYFYFYCYFQNSGADNDDFLLNALKTLLRLS